jgi:4-amino-4-deoxy-L-arabinose transferase-like glycosyltransferase
MNTLATNQFRLLVAAAVLLMLALQAFSIVNESQTYDEGVHLAAGYRYWKTGKFQPNVEHPPLQKLLSALPLVAMHPPLPGNELLFDQSAYGVHFLYKGPIAADLLLLAGRVPTMLLCALLVTAVAWLGRAWFGAAAGVTAAWLCAMDPNLIAHGRYVTTDLGSALFFLLSVGSWIRYLQAPAAKRAGWAALFTGLALGVKFSMLVLVPLLPGLLAMRWAMRQEGRWKGLGALAGVLAGAAFVVALLYGPESWRTFRGREIGVGPETIYGYTLPAHTYFTGLRTLLEHNQDGHETFLMGERSMTGWWYYFPVVMAVKSTIAFLVMAGLMALAGLRRVANIWRDPGGSFLWLALLTPAVVYLGVSMNSRINLGVRHLLPLYPLLYLLGAAALRRVVAPRRFALAAGLLVLLQSGETLAAYPEYLGFFNAAAGGREAGPRYLLDSNVDWGQDLKKLMAYQKQTKPERMCVRYFGPMEPDALGMEYSFLPRGRDRREMEEMDCIGAISVTLLHDLYMDKGDYEWLRKRKPFGMVGTSIYLYDLRKR